MNTVAKQVRVSLEAARDLIFKHYGLTTLKINEAHGTQSQNFIVLAKLKEATNQYVFKVTNNVEKDRQGRNCLFKCNFVFFAKK